MLYNLDKIIILKYQKISSLLRFPPIHERDPGYWIFLDSIQPTTIGDSISTCMRFWPYTCLGFSFLLSWPWGGSVVMKFLLFLSASLSKLSTSYSLGTRRVAEALSGE